MAEARYALVVANSRYDEEELEQLTTPGGDAKALARVLGDAAIGGFAVKTVYNARSSRVQEEIEGFFTDRRRDDLLLLYFSGHGIKNDDGKLYFAARNTRRRTLRSTAVPAAFVHDVMDKSRSRRQLLVLDCCYSGAFARELSPKSALETVATSEEFGGYGRAVLTASDSVQYAFQGDRVTGTSELSVFTRALVEGLESGDADLDQDGRVTLDELYRFVERRVAELMPEQTPKKTELDVEGEFVVARNPRPRPRAVEAVPTSGPDGPTHPTTKPFLTRKRALAGALGALGIIGVVVELTKTSISPPNVQTVTVTGSIAPASFQPASATTGCVVAAGLPDYSCTPGAVTANTARDVCGDGYVTSVRNTPEWLRARVLKAYGIDSRRRYGDQYELDHLVSLALGGSNSQANLWPQPKSPKPGYREKDSVENYLRQRVCTGQLPLAKAQVEMAHNWRTVLAKMK
jgi:hypothetical protein